MPSLHYNVKAVRAVSPVAIGTTGTGKTSAAIDRSGYLGVEVIVDYGTVTATNAAFTLLLTEADTTNGSFTSVADEDLNGTEAAAGLAAAATRTSGVSKNVTKQVGYLGIKKYLKAKISSTVTAGTPVGVTFLLHTPRHAPAA